MSEDSQNEFALDLKVEPLRECQIQELERRKSNLMKYPESGLTWDDVLKRVRGRNS